MSEIEYSQMLRRLNNIEGTLIENNTLLHNVIEQQKFMENPITWMNQREYANLLGISVQTLIKRVNDGLYDTPEGWDRECYELSGNQRAPIFDVDRANKYYHINTHKDENEHH